MNYGESILSTVGNTPLIRLDKLFDGIGFRLYGKIEALNPGGSSKDRAALAIIESGLGSGAIGPGTVVVESSSGNMGIGLAQACRFHGLRFICVVDCKASPMNLRIMAAYGAEIDVVAEPDPLSGELLQARLNRVQELLAVLPNAFWPNQYANPRNAAAHYRTTMAEVAAALDGWVDVLFVATSTCGTLRGCGEYVRDHHLGTRIIAVDALGSLIFGSQRAPRLLPGMGAGLRPALCDASLVDEVVHVTDAECVAGCRLLLRREAILAGGSSGGVVAAVSRLREGIPHGATCVAILPDRGDRYLDTIYDDDWVRKHLGRQPVLADEPGRIGGGDPLKAPLAGALAALPLQPSIGGPRLGGEEFVPEA
jgi:N-(2-amino-2-carboxyethyl)-L-glutamate synthase